MRYVSLLKLEVILSCSNNSVIENHGLRRLCWNKAQLAIVLNQNCCFFSTVNQAKTCVFHQTLQLNFRKTFYGNCHLKSGFVAFNAEKITWSWMHYCLSLLATHNHPENVIIHESLQTEANKSLYLLICHCNIHHFIQKRKRFL